MFDFLRRSIPRGIVLKEGQDGKYRWRCVNLPASTRKDAVVDETLCRTVFTDSIQDGYHSVKPCFKDALREVTQWVHPSRVRWFAESGGQLHECGVSFARGAEVIVLPASLQEGSSE